VIFFIVLGTHLAGGNLADLWLPSVVFGIFILIGNPLIVLILMKLLGYHPRVGFLVGTTVAQVSEFSFIVMSGGVAAGLIPDTTLALATAVGLVTIAGSSYIISYNEAIFEFAEKYLPFLRPKAHHDDVMPEPAPEIILIGYDRMGKKILPMIQELTDDFVVIDYNPTVIEDLASQSVRVIYGDAGNEDILKYAKVDKAKMVISAIPAMPVNEAIMDFALAHKAKGSMILTVKSSEDAAAAYAMGATFVIVPTVLGGEHFAQLLKKKKTLKMQWKSLGQKEQDNLADVAEV
jgi:hypothetical protein